MRVRLFAVVLATAFLVVGCTGQPPAGPVVGISAGGNHTCVVRGNGTVACWGDNAAGWLGDGTTTGSSVPVGVVGITDAIAVTNSDYQSCALHADGRVSCWGFNGQGQLGNGTTTASSVPVPVTGVTNATAVAIGNTHSCALLADGGVSCWGYNVNGELGNGTTVPLSTVPVPVTGITNATALAANAFHSCAVLADGGVECWGGNNYGQLGNGTSLQSNVPVAVTGLTDATDLAVGYMHTRVRSWVAAGRPVGGRVVTANSATACGPRSRWCRLRSAA
jgi:alpha-tubulin suppressor-like RCC1 family protein